MPPHALVLGVGLNGPSDIARVILELGRHEAAALVLRAPVALDDAVKDAADRSGVAVLGLTRGATWAQLAAMLRALLAEGDVGVDVGVSEPELLGGVPSGDLFALANAIAALVDAPITIEDRNSRVLAFSSGQHGADPSRVETILGRQVPEETSRLLTERGVFRQLRETDQPVFVEPLTTDQDAVFSMPRVAVGVRAGDEVLGSIWAAVHEPLSDERAGALCDAAKLVALHMLRVRAGADVERRLRSDLLGTALEGRAGAREALSRLGLANHPVVVLALDLPQPDDVSWSTSSAALLASDRQRLSDGFAVHLSAAHPRSTAALIGQVVYGLVPVPRDAPDGDARALGIASDFLSRVGDRESAMIGVGPVAWDVVDLAQARAGADRALRVLRSGTGSRRVARLDDVHAEAMILELRDLAAVRGDNPTGTLAKLLAHDARHHSTFVETLRAWLEAFGDVGTASTLSSSTPTLSVTA